MKISDAVVVAFISGVFGTVTAYITTLPASPKSIPPREDQPVKAVAPTESVTTEGFGDWSNRYEDGNEVNEYKVGQKYRARSDGFVAVLAGGDNPSREVAIYVSYGDDSKFAIRYRAMGGYGGGVAPVQKGRVWYVSSAERRPVSIAWMPAK